MPKCQEKKRKSESKSLKKKHGGSGLKKEKKLKIWRTGDEEASRRCWFALFQLDQLQLLQLQNCNFSHFFVCAGDGDEEGWEGGEEQQQASGHTPRRGKRRENQGGEYLRNPLKTSWYRLCTSG